MATQPDSADLGGSVHLTALRADHLAQALLLSSEMGWPYRLEDWQFAFGSFASTGSLSGTVWPYAGTAYPALYHGTACGWPIDTFEAYSTGSMVSGVTINSGSGWALPGVLG